MLLVVVLACLPCISHGQQAPTMDALLQSRAVAKSSSSFKSVASALHNGASVRGTENQVNALLTFLLAHDPLAAFAPAGPKARFSARASTLIEHKQRSISQPLLGPTVWSANLLSRKDEFMNYGIHTDPIHPGAVDHPQPLMANMYCRLLDGTNITGKRVLEIGSGNGGGAKVLYNYHRPAMYVGLDAAAHVGTSNARFADFGSSSLVFVDGEPTQIPFPDDSFDVVISVESSHLYDSFQGFLQEVQRVLAPNGRFLIEDFRESTAEMLEMQKEIEDVFGTTMGVFNISSNVQASVDMNPDYIAKRIDLCAQGASREECEQYWSTTNFPSFMFKVQL